MVSKLTTKIFYIILLLYSCNFKNEIIKEKDNINTDVYNEAPSELDSLKCKKCDLNKLMFNEKNFDCVQLKLFDIECLDELKIKLATKICRLFKITKKGEMRMVNFEYIFDDCIIKSHKETDKFGIFSYIILDSIIEYKLQRYKASNIEFNQILELSNSFEKVNNSPKDNSVSELFIIEIVNNGKYTKFYSNNKKLDKGKIETIESIITLKEHEDIE